MPQIAQIGATYASQIFWLIVVFGVVFTVVGLGMVPRVQGTVDLRNHRIADDLASAKAMRDEADALEEGLRATDLRNREEAHRIVAEAKDSAARANEAALSVANEAIEAKLASAEAGLGAAREAARGEIETVAAEAARDMVARLSGATVGDAAARDAVKAALA